MKNLHFPLSSSRALHRCAGSQLAHCVYLLRGKNGKTYIGYSRDPQRRLRQHNGLLKGGTAPPRGRPWKLLLDISGFRSAAEALSFEYAWQFPNASRFTYRVVEAERIPKRSPRSRPVTLQLRVLKAMLSVEKWAGVPMMINIHERGIIDYVPEADAWFSRAWEEVV